MILPTEQLQFAVHVGKTLNEFELAFEATEKFLRIRNNNAAKNTGFELTIPSTVIKDYTYPTSFRMNPEVAQKAVSKFTEAETALSVNEAGEFVLKNGGRTLELHQRAVETSKLFEPDKYRGLDNFLNDASFTTIRVKYDTLIRELNALNQLEVRFVNFSVTKGGIFAVGGASTYGRSKTELHSPDVEFTAEEDKSVRIGTLYAYALKDVKSFSENLEILLHTGRPVIFKLTKEGSVFLLAVAPITDG